MDRKGKTSTGKRPNSATSEKNQKVKIKPMIAESDSDDEFIPPPRKQVKEEPVITPTKLIATPTKPVTTPIVPSVKEEKNHVTNDIKRTAGVKRPRKKEEEESESEEESEGEESDEEELESEGETSEEEFVPAKKPKKEPTSTKPKTTPKATPKTTSSKKKPSSTTPASKTPTNKKTPTSSKSSGAKGKTTSSAKKTTETSTPTKKKKEEEKKEVWRWWDEEPLPDGVRWLTLEHKGPYFAPLYEPLPSNVKFYYDGKPVKLSEKAEEAATFFAKMLDHDYTTKEVFCSNFFTDWRKEMTHEEAKLIKNFKKCNFTEIHQYFKERSEARKQATKEEKKKLKEENEAIVEEYGWALMDGHKEKIGNFKIEPPGLFRGRGDHPKQGKIKKRILPEDVIINIGKKAPVPKPPDGHSWKAVNHDNKVTWLASWTENIQGQIKYVMLNPTSRLKGEKDMAKYETARRLKHQIEKIRENYEADFKDKEMKVRQRAVALYFIDKLALRAGNEKDADEAADTVGCCSLRVEHIKLHEEKDGKKYIVEFDFLGKDSIRYYNLVQVVHQVYKNLILFMKGKDKGDDLFDRLTTSLLNKHLSELMEGLTAKVFRTYNASITLQEQLEELTNADDSVNEKFLSYNRANRAVAVLCNHQRTAPKTFDTQMSNLQAKITAKEEAILDVKKEIKQIKKELKSSSDAKLKKEQLEKNGFHHSIALAAALQLMQKLKR